MNNIKWNKGIPPQDGKEYLVRSLAPAAWDCEDLNCGCMVVQHQVFTWDETGKYFIMRGKYGDLGDILPVRHFENVEWLDLEQLKTEGDEGKQT